LVILLTGNQRNHCSKIWCKWVIIQPGYYARGSIRRLVE